MIILGFILLLLLGPRFFNLIYWLIRPGIYSLAFPNILIGVLGIRFLPWTTLMYVISFPGGLSPWDWMFIGIGLIADISSYAGRGWGGKNQMSSSSQTTSTPPAEK